jgi:hypothetical protein
VLECAAILVNARADPARHGARRGASNDRGVRGGELLHCATSACTRNHEKLPVLCTPAVRFLCSNQRHSLRLRRRLPHVRRRADEQKVPGCREFRKDFGNVRAQDSARPVSRTAPSCQARDSAAGTLPLKTPAGLLPSPISPGGGHRHRQSLPVGSSRFTLRMATRGAAHSLRFMRADSNQVDRAVSFDATVVHQAQERLPVLREADSGLPNSGSTSRQPALATKATSSQERLMRRTARTRLPTQGPTPMPHPFPYGSLAWRGPRACGT